MSLLRLYKKIINERKHWHYTKTGIITRKVVYSRRRRSGNRLIRPTVRYIVDDKTYEYTSHIGQSPKLRKGKKVGVFYDPEDPTNAVIDTYIQRGSPYQFLGIVLIGFGLYFIYILYILVKRGY